MHWPNKFDFITLKTSYIHRKLRLLVFESELETNNVRFFKDIFNPKKSLYQDSLWLKNEIHTSCQTAHTLKTVDLGSVDLNFSAVVDLLLAFKTLETFVFIVVTTNAYSFAVT